MSPSLWVLIFGEAIKIGVGCWLNVVVWLLAFFEEHSKLCVSCSFRWVRRHGFSQWDTHKVSAENIDISQNAMEIGKACLSDSLENDSQEFSYFSLL
ncbi:MAG: hypothetical protein ABSB10_03820 [Candidatus Bathyarchaeia archaeon]